MSSAMVRFALFGRPVAHSVSPQMHARALAVLGIAGSYEARDVAPEALVDAVAELRSGAWLGANVTVPHKVAVASLLDEIDAEARAVGAVNTIERSAGRLVGKNTDARGFARSLEEAGEPLAGRTVVVLGAGGAARAVMHAFRCAGARSVTVLARERTRAEALVEGPREHAGALSDTDDMARAFERADILVQATSATMGVEGAAFVASLPLGRLREGAVVIDLVYRPRTTVLLEAADKRGLKTVDGVGMLVHQGALALAGWLGRPVGEIPLGAMRDAALEAL